MDIIKDSLLRRMLYGSGHQFRIDFSKKTIVTRKSGRRIEYSTEEGLILYLLKRFERDEQFSGDKSAELGQLRRRIELLENPPVKTKARKKK